MCALGTGVQTCALPISLRLAPPCCRGSSPLFHRPSFRLPLSVGGEEIVPAQPVPRTIDGVGEQEPAPVPQGGCGRAGRQRDARRRRQVTRGELLAEIAELIARHRDHAPARGDRGAPAVIARTVGLLAGREQWLALLYGKKRGGSGEAKEWQDE